MRGPAQIHPATRTFQALRIFVNEELIELANALVRGRTHSEAGRTARRRRPSIRWKTASSRPSSPTAASIVAGSRHAPETRGPQPTFAALTKKPVTADEAEIAGNPRARSAKLRAAQRTEAPARDTDPADLLPRLPDLDDVMRGR